MSRMSKIFRRKVSHGGLLAVASGLTCLFLGSVANADYFLSLDKETYVSTRAAGMAGVGLGFVDDFNAIFLNPAKLGTGSQAAGLRSLSFPALSVESTRYSTAFAKELTNSGSLGGDITPVLEGLDGKRGVHFRQQFFPNLVFGRVFAGLLQSTVLNAQSYRLRTAEPSRFSDEAVSFDRAADVYFRSEVGLVTGFSAPMSHQADFGVMARYGMRTLGMGTAELGAGTEEASGSAITDGVESYQGFNVDAGLFWRIHDGTGLGLSVVGRNLGEGQYTVMETSSGASDRSDPSDLDAGLSLSPKSRKSPFSPSFGVEVHDILRDDLPFSDKIRFGGELAFGNDYRSSWLAVRAGHDLHGSSYGASIDLFLFRFEVAIYNTIVVLPIGESRNDPRFILRTSWDLQQ